MWRVTRARFALRLVGGAAAACLAGLVLSVMVVRPLAAGPHDPRTSCLTHLERLATALRLYMQDWEDTLPSSILAGPDRAWYDRVWDADRFTSFASQRSLPPSPGGSVLESWPMVLAPYLSDQSTIWCPSDPATGDNPYALVSYYWKAAVDYAWFAGLDREGCFEFQSHQIILYERAGWHWGGAEKGLVDGVRINCVFLDGRAASVEIRDSGYAAAESPAAPVPTSGVGEPAWFNYSFGASEPQFSRGGDWDPSIWGDNLAVVEQPVGEPRKRALDQCQSNLRKLAMAVQRYQCDWDGWLPSSCLYGGSETWNADDFVRFAGERGILPPREPVRASWPELLYWYLPQNDAIWCPSDPDQSSDPASPVSYYWKAAADRAWYGGFRKMGDFSWPDQQIILYEHNDWHWGRHNQGLADGVRVNCAFLDGHVAAKEIRNSGYTHRENPPWPLPVSGIGEPAWYNYSLGAETPQFDTGANWNPMLWCDNLR